jgi:septum formation protein
MNFKRPLILASSSPRRQFLMHEIGFSFIVRSPDIDESFPVDMPVQTIPSYLAEKKAKVFDASLRDEIVVASDTVVILDGMILNKPVDRHDAIRMLSLLSGKTHQVITAVCLHSKTKTVCFDDRTDVTFKKIPSADIEFYVDHFNPLDKAGSYGAQDCLPPGMNPCSVEEIDFLKSIHKEDLIAKTISEGGSEKTVVIIDKLNGAYFTVMGLPVHLVYEHLASF